MLNIYNLDKYTLVFNNSTFKWVIGYTEKLYGIANNIQDNKVISGYEQALENYLMFSDENSSDSLVDWSFKEIKACAIIPTFKCNLSCKHCFYGASLDSQGELRSTDIPKIIDLLQTIQPILVAIPGGEPFIYSDIVKLIDEILIKTTATILIMTNATAIPYDELKEWAKKYKKRLIIQASTDAATPETYKYFRGGDFNVVIDNIRKIKELGIPIDLSYTITNKNAHDFLAFIKLAEELNIHRMHFPLLENVGRAENNKLQLPKNINELFKFLVYS